MSPSAVSPFGFADLYINKLLTVSYVQGFSSFGSAFPSESVSTINGLLDIKTYFTSNEYNDPIFNLSV